METKKPPLMLSRLGRLHSKGRCDFLPVRSNFLTLVNMRYLPILLLFLISCRSTRHIETTISRTDSTAAHRLDSAAAVNRLLMESYENLLQSKSATVVEFDTIYCPPVVGFPTEINRIKVRPDGSIEAEGRIRSVSASNESLQKENRLLRNSVNQLVRLVKTDTASVSHETKATVKDVKRNGIPFRGWLIIGLLAALWLNERFRIYPIPILNRK
jgi:hypothetical protein